METKILQSRECGETDTLTHAVGGIIHPAEFLLESSLAVGIVHLQVSKTWLKSGLK